MRRPILILMTWCALVCAVPAALAAPDGAPPRIEVAEPLIDLGDVLRGTRVDLVFHVRNTGGSPLTILGAKPG